MCYIPFNGCRSCDGHEPPCFGSYACCVREPAEHYLHASAYWQKKSGHKDLSITIPESLDYTEVFDDIFEKYLSECELVSVKTTNMGSLFKLKYRIELKDGANEKKLIDELRCRNGNLEIMCAVAADIEEQSF